LLSILMPRPEYKIKIAKMRVRSATLDPSKVPRPNSGIPSIIEFIEIKVSGIIEINAIITKPIIYFESLKFRANLSEYLVAIVALLTTRISEKIKIKEFIII